MAVIKTAAYKTSLKIRKQITLLCQSPGFLRGSCKNKFSIFICKCLRQRKTSRINLSVEINMLRDFLLLSSALLNRHTLFPGVPPSISAPAAKKGAAVLYPTAP